MASTQRSLVKSMSVISAGTLSSRILGFVRDILLARILGTGFQADAFFVAMKIPNLFRDMVGEGATNSALVPVLAEYLNKDNRNRYWRFVTVMLFYAVLVLALITFFGVILAPVIVRLIAPGFMGDPEKLQLTVRLTRLLFPYLIFIGLTAFSMSILFSFKRFAVPAFTSCLLNMAIIIGLLLSVHFNRSPLPALVAAVLVGGFLQLVMQVRPLLHVGFKFFGPVKLRHPGVSRVGRLLIPRILGAGVYQLNVLIDTFCASLAWAVGAGGISAIYYANRVIQFPMGVFGFAVASAALPTMSSLASNKDLGAMRKALVFSLENILFVMVPMSLFTVVLAQPIVRILFERGEFGAYSTSITTLALIFYATGLVSFGGIKILVAGFHALQDTRTPVKVAAICLVLNAVLNWLLMWPLKIGGIALASAVSATLDLLLLYWFLGPKIGGWESSVKTFMIKILAAVIPAALVVNVLWKVLPVHEILRLGLAGLAGLCVYQLLCMLFRVEQAHHIARWIIRK